MDYSKPGCFGNAITYSSRSKVCMSCSENQSCALAALQRIEELKPMVSVDSILKMSHKPPEKLSSRLPESAQNIVAKMNSMQRKIVGVLMTMDQPTPANLVEALMQRLQLPKEEAISGAKETVIVLIKARLAATEGGRIILRF